MINNTVVKLGVRPRRIRQGQGGIILLEAVLSVVLVSVSLVVVVHAYLTSYRGHVQAADFTRAMILLDNHMTEVFFDSSGVLVYPSSGEKKFPAPFEKFESKWEVGKMQSGQRPMLNTLEVTVSWLSGQKEKHFTAATLVFNPKQNE